MPASEWELGIPSEEGVKEGDGGGKGINKGERDGGGEEKKREIRGKGEGK